MPVQKPLQSEQEVGPQFNAFMQGFAELALSYTMANALMHYTASMLIQLSLTQQTVKLLESQVAGKNFTGTGIAAIAAKLDSRLSDLYQGIASFQLTRHMQNVQQSSNSAATLQMAGQVLDQKITKLNETNKHIKTLTPNAAKKHLDDLAKGKNVKDGEDKSVDNDKTFKPTKRR